MICWRMCDVVKRFAGNGDDMRFANSESRFLTELDRFGRVCSALLISFHKHSSNSISSGQNCPKCFLRVTFGAYSVECARIFAAKITKRFAALMKFAVIMIDTKAVCH
jgi:hypothetical protein